MLSIVAFQIHAVAVGWQVYSMSGRALDLGLVGLAQFVPMILLTLLVGHTADRHDRRVISSLCQTAEGLATATMAYGTLTGRLDVPHVLAIVAVIGAARAFEGPTMSALMPGLVPRELLPQASAWYASATQTAQIVGPAVGGLLFGVAPSAPYVTAAILFLSAALLLVRGGPDTRLARASTALESFFSGILFIRRHRILLGVLSLDLFAVLVGGVTALMPIYARDILATGPWGLGLLRAAPAMGALTMSVLLARRPVSRRVGVTMFGAVVVFGVAILVFGVSRSLPLSLAALVMLGGADVVSVVIRYTLVQLSTPDDMRGRVSAAFSLFTGTSNQLGEFRAGVFAAVLGVVPAVLLGGLGTVAVALIWMVVFPELRRVRGFA